ncbi:MAG: hypothetical protein ACLSE6_04885 [Alphaproteobacteria bacterium]
MRLFEGYCLGSAMMCLESWLNTRANNDNRGTIMSLYMITTYLGSSLGQLLLNIPTQNGVTIYVTVSVLFSIALVPVSLTALPTPDITVYRSMSLSRLYKVSPEGVVGCVVSGIFVGIFYTLGPIYPPITACRSNKPPFHVFRRFGRHVCSASGRAPV